MPEFEELAQNYKINWDLSKKITDQNRLINMAQSSFK